MFMRGLKRKSITDNPPVQRAKILTKEDLCRVNDFLLSRENPSLRQWRTVWRMNLAFMCLLRWDDVCRLRVSLHIVCVNVNYDLFAIVWFFR
jgi:hypothetical protein